MQAWMLINEIEMIFKSISRQDLVNKTTKIINAPYTKISDFFYKSPQWKRTEKKYMIAL